MDELLKTIQMWNTPYIGAYFLWRFADGYGKASNGRGAPLLLFFIAAALVTEKRYVDVVPRRTFKTFVRFFIEKKQVSALAALQGAINMKRAYTCAAIERAVLGGYLVWNKENGTLSARKINRQLNVSSLPEDVRAAGKAAEKIGEWFAGEELPDICMLLGVKLS